MYMSFCICYFHPSFPGALRLVLLCLVYKAWPRSSADSVPRDLATTGSRPSAKLPLKHLLGQYSPQIPYIAAWGLLAGLHTFRNVKNGFQQRPVHFLASSFDHSPLFSGSVTFTSLLAACKSKDGNNSMKTTIYKPWHLLYSS